MQWREYDVCVKRILKDTTNEQHSPTKTEARDRLMLSSTIWTTTTQGGGRRAFVMNGEEEPVWLTPHLRDTQHE